MRRRTFMLVAAAAGGGAVAARAQDAWPVRTVRFVVPQAAGSPMEIPARIIADRLGRRIGASVIVENRPGAGSGLGSQYVAQSPPDGSVFLVTSAAISTVATLQPALGFDPGRDLEPVSIICDVPSGLLVRADSRFRSVQELLAHARAHPGDLNLRLGRRRLGQPPRRRAVRRPGGRGADPRAIPRRQPGGERGLRGRHLADFR